MQVPLDQNKFKDSKQSVYVCTHISLAKYILDETKMEPRFIAKLIFFLLTVEASSADDEERRSYKCRQSVPENCHNTGIRIHKTSDVYKLKLCSNYQCAPVSEDSYDMILNCGDICSACHTLLGTALGQSSKT